jgi:hypothetical protein
MNRKEFRAEVAALGATVREGRVFERGRRPGALVSLDRDGWTYQAQAPKLRDARIMALMLLRRDS